MQHLINKSYQITNIFFFVFCGFISAAFFNSFNSSPPRTKWQTIQDSTLTHWPLGDFNKVLEKIIFKLILVTDGCDISSEIALRWTSRDLSDKSTLVQVMTWCRQATSHYLSQCWARSLCHMASLGPNELRLAHTSRACRFCFKACKLLWLCAWLAVSVPAYFPSSIHQLYKACTDIGRICGNFCRAWKFLEPCARWSCETNAYCWLLQ